MVELYPYMPEFLGCLKHMLGTQDYNGISDITNETLPKVGFIAFVEEKDAVVPVAAGFLRMVEGGFAQMDTLMSNAEYPSDIRHEAISQVVDSLIAEAKNLKLSGILATSKDKGTIMRALSIGFHIVSEQQLIALPLKEYDNRV